MAIGCGGTFAKIILIIYNIIFLLSGLVLIALGIWLLADGSVKGVIDLTFNGKNSDLFRNAAILLITMGVVVLLISILGFVAAILENTVLLGIYIGFLVLIFCGEVAGGVLAIVFKDDILENLRDVLGDSLSEQLNQTNKEHYYMTETNNGTATGRCYTSDVGYLWDFVQIKFECCGVTDKQSGYEQLAPGYNFKNMCGDLVQPYFPLSCYRFKNSTTKFKDFHKKPDNQYDAQKLVDFNNAYTGGCYESVGKWVEKYAPVLIGIGIGFAMLELFGIIFAVCLCRNVEDDD